MTPSWRRGGKRFEGGSGWEGDTGGWSSLSEGLCKVELKFTVVTVRSVLAGPAGQTGRENCYHLIFK